MTTPAEAFLDQVYSTDPHCYLDLPEPSEEFSIPAARSMAVALFSEARGVTPLTRVLRDPLTNTLVLELHDPRAIPQDRLARPRGFQLRARP